MGADIPKETLALFVSDIHLDAPRVKTTAAFDAFIGGPASRARLVFILGDLFEYWAGDDGMDAYAEERLKKIKALTETGTSVFWICGNRDFLTDRRFLDLSGMKRLPDLFMCNFAGTKIAFAHGDAQCTDDEAYMKFRKMVRNPFWRRGFLFMPLSKRLALAQKARRDSKMTRVQNNKAYSDINLNAAKAAFDETGASVFIHGHTHMPDEHDMSEPGSPRRRIVLSDWDFDGENPRGDAIEVTYSGGIVRRQIQAP